MKRMLVLFILAVFACSAALAELPDLNAGGLPDIDISPVILAPIPDPGETLGTPGTAYQKGYAYHDKMYDLYLFSMPDSTEAFITAYTTAAQDAGYVVKPGSEEGYTVYYIDADDIHALLFPDYQNHMMLMVPDGADFVLHDNVASAPVPQMKSNYASLDYNGRHYESYDGSNARADKWPSTGRSWFSMYFGFDKLCPFSSIHMYIPASVGAGDILTISKSDGQGTKYTTSRNECNVNLMLGKEKLIEGGRFYSYYYDYSSNSDTFTITITKAEHTDNGYLIEGKFEGSIASKKDTVKAVIENGFFTTYVDID